MNWIQVTIYTTAEGIEPVSGRLYQLGITGIEIEDKDDFVQFLENNRQSWDYVDEELMKSKMSETCIKIYVSDNAAGSDMLKSVKDSLQELKRMDTENAFGRLEMAFCDMDEEDWANNWKQYFKPLPVGDKILIQPEWEPLTEATDRTVFTVNPGMSFGTGTHFTTQLCIEELEHYITPDTHVLDLGCGSGILSIIALLLGAKDATAIDIDPNAVEIAYQNAQRNHIEKQQYRVLAGNIITDTKLKETIQDKKYDVVLANIVADVIIAIKEIVPKLLKDGGILITSGIIDERKEDVLHAYADSGLEMVKLNQKGDWVAIVYQN